MMFYNLNIVCDIIVHRLKEHEENWFGKLEKVLVSMLSLAMQLIGRKSASAILLVCLFLLSQLVLPKYLIHLLMELEEGRPSPLAFMLLQTMITL